MSQRISRRRFLQLGSTAAVFCLAGCLNDNSSNTESQSGDGSDDDSTDESNGGGDTSDDGSDDAGSLDPVTVDEEWPSYQVDLANTGATSNTGPASGNLAERWYLEVKEGDGVVNQPLVVDGTVYAGDADGVLHAVDAASGEVEWETDVDTTIRNTPAYADGMVYVPAMAKVYAFDAASGEQEWEYQHNGDVPASPTVFDGTVYAGNDYPEVVAMNAETGETQWTYTPSEGGGIDTSPAVVDGRVFVGTWNGELVSLDAGTGEEAWSKVLGEDYEAGLTVADDTIYAPNKDGNVYAVDAETGDERWRFETESMSLGAPAYRDGLVYTADKRLHAVDAESGEKEWDSRVRASAPVVVTENSLLVTETDQLIAFDPATGDRQWEAEAREFVTSAPVVVNELVLFTDMEGLSVLQPA